MLTTMKNVLKVIFYILLFVLLIILPVRSTQYIYRIYKEFRNPVREYKTQITGCENPGDYNNVEDERLCNYRKVGVSCEN